MSTCCPVVSAAESIRVRASRTANYGGTVREIKKARRVNAAFQQVLDHPQAAEALQHPALQALLAEASD